MSTFERSSCPTWVHWQGQMLTESRDMLWERGPFDMPNDSRITVHSGRCICMLLFWFDFGFGTEWPKILQTYACMSSGLADKQSSKWVYGNSLVQLCKWCYFKALEIQVSSLAKSLIESISHSHSCIPTMKSLSKVNFNVRSFVILSNALDARNKHFPAWNCSTDLFPWRVYCHLVLSIWSFCTLWFMGVVGHPHSVCFYRRQRMWMCSYALVCAFIILDIYEICLCSGLKTF